MFTVAMCINFLFLFIRSCLSSLLFFFFFVVSLLCAALSLLCSLSLIGDSPICGGGCLRTASFWWVGGCGFAVCDCGGVGLCFGWLPWDSVAWVWVCWRGLWWVWVCRSGCLGGPAWVWV